MHLGGRVKQVRESLKLGQAELCAMVPGLSQQTLSGLEKRDSKTSEFAVRIADALGVSLRWLLDGTGSAAEADWPFPRVNRARWDACSAEDRGYIQAAMNRALDDCDGASSKRTGTG